MIVFKADTRAACAVTDDAVTTSSVGIPVQFIFSDDWAGTQKIAVFQSGETAVDIALTGSSTVVPPECLEDPGEWLKIGVYGATPDGTVVIPTVWASVAVTALGCLPSGVDPSEPTPSWVAQVQEMAEEALARAQVFPEGGAAGAALIKDSAADFDASWKTLTATDDGDGNVTISFQ